jgi:alpha-D-ribose 1-methylphosphonate 5-triphosphate synthase subunit PhnH
MSDAARVATIELKSLRPGFADPASQSQIVFRCALRAFSHPGSVHTLSMSDALRGMRAPEGADPAAAGLLLALLDQDCKVWMSPQFAHSDALAWLRFHTGCVAVNQPEQADFLWVAQASDLPDLRACGRSSAQYPEQGATCVVQVQGLQTDGAWTLRGPGITGVSALQVAGLGDGFLTQWRAQQLHFPCGVDLLFTHQNTLVGLPRSTLIEV